MPRSVAADPRPLPPPSPDLNDCCCSGCNPCVFDLYQDALERYQRELQAWEQRHAAGGKKRVAAKRRA